MKVHTEMSLVDLPKGDIKRMGRKKSRAKGPKSLSILDKLQELVPNMSHGKKLTKLEIIQNVIDYILDLQIALETHPASRSPNAEASGTSQRL
ncbi:hypothetical protein V5799_029765 [Amblyomma americanum]|uniref:BHLH domain-containing protein n=1 Tax=Amblyomma americanum TaxID=6943 RepID=A0AAQ4EQ55_AMBAM